MPWLTFGLNIRTQGSVDSKRIQILTQDSSQQLHFGTAYLDFCVQKYEIVLDLDSEVLGWVQTTLSKFPHCNFQESRECKYYFEICHHFYSEDDPNILSDTNGKEIKEQTSLQNIADTIHNYNNRKSDFEHGYGQ